MGRGDLLEWDKMQTKVASNLRLHECSAIQELFVLLVHRFGIFSGGFPHLIA